MNTRPTFTRRNSLSHLSSVCNNYHSEIEIKDEIENYCRRTFHFSIENNENLSNIESGLLSNVDSSLNYNCDITEQTDNMEEWTADFMLSKLYIRMKISEVSKHCISVFEMTFPSKTDIVRKYIGNMNICTLRTHNHCNINWKQFKINISKITLSEKYEMHL